MKILGDVGAGHVLGRYELLLPIASGGMATVWAARMKGSRGFQKIVAVKTMLPSMSDDPQFEQMFLDEAALASRIRHPNVAEILDLGEESGVLFLVMEWVDGESLSVLMKSGAKKGGIPLPVALRVVMSVCAGLHAAHELRDEGVGNLLGVVHRDVSPQNILVTFDGVVKVVDFGVAKAAGRATSQTSAGQVKGKAAYMSPEQAQGAPIDRRTDVFAVGILLYQLTTGKHPFRGENEVATLYNICSEDAVTPPTQYVPDYPALLVPVVERALAKKADARYASSSEFGRALDAVAREIGAASEEEVAAFIRELLGDRQDKRNETLKAALRLADDRSSRREGDENISHTGFTPVSSVTLPGMGAATDPEATAPGSGRPNLLNEVTSADSDSPAVKFSSARRRSTWLTAALLAGAVLIGMAAAYRYSRGDRDAVSAAVPEAPRVLVTPTPVAPAEAPANVATNAALAAAASPSSSAAEVENGNAQVKDEKGAGKGTEALATSATAPAGKVRGAGRASTNPASSSRRPTTPAPRGSAPFVAPVRNPGF